MGRHAAQVRRRGRRIALMERSGCCWSQTLAPCRYTIMCSLINSWADVEGARQWALDLRRPRRHRAARRLRHEYRRSLDDLPSRHRRAGARAGSPRAVRGRGWGDGRGRPDRGRTPLHL